MTNPVQPGEKLLPRMTAEWYNSTLKPPTVNEGTPTEPINTQEGRKHCLAAGIITAFKPAGILQSLDPQERATPLVSLVSFGPSINNANWCIPQESTIEDGTVLTVIYGITRATVKKDNNGPMVYWDPVSEILRTGNFGKAILLEHNGDGIGEALIYISSLSPPDLGFINFTTTGKMTNLEVQVTIDTVHSWPINDATGNIYEPGDSIKVHDPHNQFSDVEANARGTAFLRRTSFDDPNTSPLAPGGNEYRPARFEILTCTQPVNELLVQFNSCLTAFQIAATVLVAQSNNEIRSTYPNVDAPPEISTNGVINPIMTVFNINGLDAVTGSYGVVRRTTNKQISRPTNYDTPKSRSTTNVIWELISVTTPHARFISVTKGGSSDWELTAAYTGGNPNVCGTSIVCDPVSCACAKTGAKGYAFYDSNSDTYRVFSTQSALLGDIEYSPMLTGVELKSTGLEFTKIDVAAFCKEELGPTLIPTTDCEEDAPSSGA